MCGHVAVACGHEQVSPVDAREIEDLILALIALVHQPQDRDPDALQDFAVDLISIPLGTGAVAVLPGDAWYL